MEKDTKRNAKDCIVLLQHVYFLAKTPDCSVSYIWGHSVKYVVCTFKGGVEMINYSACHDSAIDTLNKISIDFS